MLIDIPDSSDFHTAAEDLINSAWNSLTKLLENHEVIESLGSEEKAIGQYWLYAKPELTSALAMVQHAVEFYLKAKILSVSPYLLISLDSRSLPSKSEVRDVSFSEFRTLDAQDLLRIHNTFALDRLADEFKQWFNDMRSMRNKIMHTVDKTISVEPARLARSILECHEYLVGKNCWIKSRVKYLNRSPEHGVGIGGDHDNENDSYIHLAIHREISLVIKRLESSDSKRFFKYNKQLPAAPCPACYKVFYKCEYLDDKAIDSYVHTMQGNDFNNEVECVICGHVAEVSELQCEKCSEFVVDKATKECSKCTIFGGEL